MGINGLWEILGDGHVTSIAQVATEHFERTQRPLRIAVDEAGWRFSNLTPAQVESIRRKEPRANPIEKLIFWRLTRLLKLNIQLIFVFDGPHRPWKRNGVAGRIDYSKIELLRQVLDVFRIPQHRAPAEAEAECARLQELGIVDAVWSDDGDTLMFGCDFLIRDHRDVDGQKNDGQVRVYRSESIHSQYRLDRPGLVAFAMLSGGDYDTTGLKGCGPQLALKAAQHGLGKSLCECHDQTALLYWRERLVSFLGTIRAIEVPLDFPRLKHVKNYKDPRVSTPHELQNLRGLRFGWDVCINEAKLRDSLHAWFNIWTRGYIKHIGPLLLAKRLVRISAEQQAGSTSSDSLDIELVQPKRRKSSDLQRSVLRKVTFWPSAATGLDIATQPEGEDWSVFTTKAGVIYDPLQPVECEMLECLLRAVLPEALLSQDHQPTTTSASAAPRKRKPTEDPSTETNGVSLGARRQKRKAPLVVPGARKISPMPPDSHPNAKGSGIIFDLTQETSGDDARYSDDLDASSLTRCFASKASTVALLRGAGRPTALANDLRKHEATFARADENNMSACAIVNRINAAPTDATGIEVVDLTSV